MLLVIAPSMSFNRVIVAEGHDDVCMQDGAAARPSTTWHVCTKVMAWMTLARPTWEPDQVSSVFPAAFARSLTPSCRDHRSIVAVGSVEHLLAKSGQLVQHHLWPG
jgi:hypothetical protein